MNQDKTTKINMRQNKSDSKSLLEKKAKRDLKHNPDGSKMIQEHKIRTAKVKLKSVRVPEDPFKTVFYIRSGKDPQEVIERYKKSRKY